MSTSFAVHRLLAVVALAAFWSCARPSPPEVKEIRAIPRPTVAAGHEASLAVEASGAGPLEFKWSASRGTVEPRDAPVALYKAPATPGVDSVTVEVRGKGGSTIRNLTIRVTEAGPRDPMGGTLPAGKVTFGNLQDGQQVPCEVAVRGLYSVDLQGRLWPVVYVAGRYHPQDEGGNPPVMAKGTWYGTVRFGDCTHPERDRGKAFQLVLVTADEQADRAFRDYIDKARRTGDFPGLEELPPGAVERARVQVIRDQQDIQPPKAKVPGP